MYNWWVFVITTSKSRKLLWWNCRKHRGRPPGSHRRSNWMLYVKKLIFLEEFHVIQSNSSCNSSGVGMNRWSLGRASIFIFYIFLFIGIIIYFGCYLSMGILGIKNHVYLVVLARYMSYILVVMLNKGILGLKIMYKRSFCWCVIDLFCFLWLFDEKGYFGYKNNQIL